MNVSDCFTGRRQCIGESLGQVAIFMFLTAIVQEFSFEIPEDSPQPSRETIRGISSSPVPYFVRVIPRKVENCL